MAALNNVGGVIVKNGKVVYEEKLDDDLYFKVITSYSPSYSGKILEPFSSYPHFVCKAVITTRGLHTYSNGVISVPDALTVESVKKVEDFRPINPPYFTKNGHKVYQKDFDYEEYELDERGKRVKMKSRKLLWLIEVSEADLLKYCLTK